MPCLPRRTVPLDEHDTSYFADSASMRNRSRVLSVNMTMFFYVSPDTGYVSPDTG